jgi:predicted ATPase with chaperone activity
MNQFDSPPMLGPAGPALPSAAHVPAAVRHVVAAAPVAGDFVPPEPATLDETGLAQPDIEALVLKLLLASGPTVGRRIAEQLRLPFGLVADQLRSFKAQMLLNYSNQATMGDFEYALTDEGQQRAQWHAGRCTYCGAAPVPLADYIASVERQSIRKLRPKLPDLCAAFSDLLLSPALLSQVGQAVHAGRGLFLYGQPGNGKTSVAERVIRAASQYIWIPRTITVTGETIRLFDPANHEEAPLTSPQGQLIDALRYDRRWVRIRRPSIVVGGELKLEQLEITNNPVTGILESPVQLKSNCGALVIDDFGRQRCSTAELLNRWIVPLEKGHDYLHLPSGRQIQVPFDQLLIFSTNLEPHKLVDEAFLRRIPYKIEMGDPSPREFRDLVRQWCGRLAVEYHDDAVDHLLSRHYNESSRPLRYCHPRDLVLQVKAFCEFHEQPLVLSAKALDVAVKNYFAGL